MTVCQWYSKQLPDYDVDKPGNCFPLEKQEKTKTTNNRKNTIPQLEIQEAY